MGVKFQPTLPEWRSSCGKNPASYIADKLASHRLILLGTQHNNEQIHGLIFDILPGLVKESGVNTLFVEISSNQQPVIERFKKGICPVEDININKIIASQAYLKILVKAQDLGMDIIAIDNGENKQINRDQWMASCVLNYLTFHPSTKGLVIVGNRHVLKNVKWTYGGDSSLADYLKPMKTFSVVSWPGAIEGGLPVALDIDRQVFLGVKDPTLMCMNILPQTSLATSADGVIFLSD
jgi:uncharacterized iron-regulated protein